MNQSAQAIVIDRNRNIYLERNTKINALSFIGGKLEEEDKNSLSACVIREIGEEIGLLLDVGRLLEGQKQEQRKFSTGTWESTYFVVILDESEVTIINNKDNIEVYTQHDFKELSDNDFPFERQGFLSQIQRALDCL